MAIVAALFANRAGQVCERIRWIFLGVRCFWVWLYRLIFRSLFFSVRETLRGIGGGIAEKKDLASIKERLSDEEEHSLLINGTVPD